jgi:chromosome partitioning protein
VDRARPWSLSWRQRVDALAALPQAVQSFTESAPESHEVVQLSKVIAIANQKGGVGKTTCSINLGGALAELGYRVLCIDMDPQANLTVGLGIALSDVRQSMADVLSDDRILLEQVVRPTEMSGLMVAPATLELASTEVELFSAIGREMVLRDALAGWADQQFDVVIIDCPPTLGLLTINALVGSSRVIIPVQTQYYAIKGLTALMKVINTIKQKLNHDLEILGLLATFYDGRTVLAREMLENLRELGDLRIFNTMIKNTVKLGEAPLTGKPVTEYATNSQAARAFRDLAREVIELG